MQIGKIITYIVCSLFELFQFTFICNLESFSFARWRSVNIPTTFLVTDLPILKQFVHSPTYGCALSVANTSMCGERRALAFGRKMILKKLWNTLQRLRLEEFSSDNKAQISPKPLYKQRKAGFKI